MKLDGGEIDTLYKLARKGPQEDGDLPSKSGMIGLIQKGLAVKDYKMPLPNMVTSLGMATLDNHMKESTK